MNYMIAFSQPLHYQLPIVSWEVSNQRLPDFVVSYHVAIL
jgi:hypothetical protein